MTCGWIPAEMRKLAPSFESPLLDTVLAQMEDLDGFGGEKDFGMSVVGKSIWDAKEAV